MSPKRVSGPPPPSPPPKLVVSRAEAEEKLGKQIRGGEIIRKLEIGPGNWATVQASEREWHEFNKELLTRLFDTDAIAREYEWATPIGIVGVRVGRTELHEEMHDFHVMLDTRLQKLRSIRKRLEIIPDTAPASASKQAVAAR